MVQQQTTDNIVQLNASPSETASGNDYTLSVRDAGNNDLSELLSFVIDDRCYGYNDVEIIFLDRLGSILPMQFTYKIDTDISIKREESKRDISTDTMYDYSLTDAGVEVDNIEEEKTLTLRTSRLNTEMAVYFKELVSSGWTALRIGTSGNYMRCNIQTSSFKLLDSYVDGMRTYEIKVKYSNKDIINW